jgi:ligand-binding sensor domain-containing protein
MHREAFFLAYFFIWTTAAAQQYSFGSFTIEDGLSNNVVYAAHKNSKGYLWIATHDGLNRYEFKKFLHDPFNKKASPVTRPLIWPKILLSEHQLFYPE